MLPITLDVKQLHIVVVGNGHAARQRLTMLEQAGATQVKHHATPPLDEAYDGAHIVFVADFDDETSAKIAKVVREKNILLNIEDKRPYCDFHVPAIVRRGELLFAIATGGASPRLAVRIKEYLQEKFPEEWAEHLQTIKEARLTWLAEGADYKTLSANTDALLDELGVLQ